MGAWSYFYNVSAFILKGFKTKSVREFYDSAAANYDKAMRMQDYAVRKIIEQMPKCNQGLDLGLGTGITSYHMRKKCNSLISVDFSDGMINESRKKLGLEPKILKCNLLDLPLADNSIDIAVSTGAIRHIPAASYEKFFSEVSRVVKDCFITESRDYTSFEKIYYKIYGKFMGLLGHSEQPLNSDKGNLESILKQHCFEPEFRLFPGKSKRNYIVLAHKKQN